MEATSETRLAFTGGTVWTMDVGPDPDVVVVCNDRIEAVGGRELLELDGIAVVDLGGDHLLPGFIDAHHHLSIAAMDPVWGDLSAATDVDDVARALRDMSERSPESTWVRGCYWPSSRLRLTRDDLDDMGLDRPAIAVCGSLHQAVVSSAGLDALGIGLATPDPPGGRIERGDSGNPTGVLVERAWSPALVASTAGAGLDDVDRLADLIERRAKLLTTFGVTALHDTATSMTAEAAYRRLVSEHRLPISVVGFPCSAGLLTGPDPDRWDGPTTGEGDEWFRVGPVKLFADGAFESACNGHIRGRQVQFGMLLPGLLESMHDAVRHGYGVAVHAIGNAGIASTLDLWERATHDVEPEHGLRIEHVGLAGQRELDRMVELGATGVIQPGFIGAMAEAMGSVRWDDLTWLPFGDLLSKGVPLAASSDSPCVPTPAPLTLSQFGVTRCGSSGAELEPDQAIPLREWLRLWTAGAADAGGQTAERGRIRPGLRADFVVLDGDIDGDGAEPAVVQTWIGGALAYQRAER